MSPLKEAAMVTIRRLPDECSAEDIVREVSFAVRVFDSLKHSKNSGMVSQAEMMKMNRVWENDF